MFVPSRLLLLLSLCGLCLLAAAPAAGQIIYGQQAAAGLDIIATHWKLNLDQDEVTINQWAFPASAFIPLRENLEARVYVAQAMTSVTQLGQDYEAKGLTDMRLQVNHAFYRDRLLIGAGVNLPMGHKELSLDEDLVVMNYLSQSFLSFPVRRLGEGFGLNLMAGGATEVGDFRLGATATVDLTGAYQAYLTQDDYKPGNTFNLTVGLQRELKSFMWNGDVTLITSADDKLGDIPVFSRGSSVALHTGIAGSGAVRAYHVDATYLVRGRNTVYDPAGELLQQLKVYGNEFVLAAAYERTTDSGWRFGPAADLRLIAGNEYGFGKSTVLGAGGQVIRGLTPAVDLRLTLKYFTGSTHDGDIDLTGFQAWLAASGTF